ncbi:GntR family transcriptional regulator [Fictibacillus terranigra]|uniref:GntR family transcriptional regulator n=1 Tax=Fictibacillus terranigra TaxID=3058424 RepID=A0ABT8EDS8_9BACL|nr:GntR family transcriptional regulator [Fictibacillus sp. CENA-BCM004]MDN4076017.1 GntR family transcriptional regulator [Fictibacillus sp. CENA-BCM004]
MRIQLERQNPVPLYYQITKILEKEITEGLYKAGDHFSTEMELQKDFNVSRATIRKALEPLESNGLIFRVTGKGIFISPVKLSVDLPNLLSFSEEMEKRGKKPSAKLLSVEVIDAPHVVSEALQIGERAKTIVIRRIRLGDDMPIVYSDSYLPDHIGLTLNDDFSGSLYELLHVITGRPVVEAKHTIEASIANQDMASYLDVNEGFPLLSFRRIGYDPSSQPIVYETGLARSDKYSYDIYLKK